MQEEICFDLECMCKRIIERLDGRLAVQFDAHGVFDFLQ
jgi:hypothetical protein